MEPRIGFARTMARKYLKRHRITAPPVPVEAIIATELLMPLALFKREWRAKPDVERLAERYLVSREAAWWRIRGFPIH